MSPATAPRQRSRTSEVITRRRDDRDSTALAGMADDLDLDSLVFNWLNERVPDLEVRNALTAISIERTIEGASTVEVALRDPDNRIFAGSRMWEPKVKRDKSGRATVEYDYFGQRITTPGKRGRALEMDLDGIVFRLVRVSKSGDEVSLTFEDRIITWLRAKKGTKRAARDRVTRAQFILSLLREVKADRIRFVCPELNLRQPIDKPTTTVGSRRLRGPRVASSQSDPTSRTNHKTARGVAPTRTLTVAGKPATAEQRRIGERCLAVADTLGAGPKASLALMEAVIVESGIRNIPYGDSSSVGVLQLLNIHGSATTRLNVEWCVRKFLQDGFTGRGGAIALAKKNPSMSAGQVAQGVQGSAFPARYDQVQREATAWVNAYAGSGASVAESDAAGGNTGYQSYQFAREGDEDSWTAIQRLATEVGWRAFVMGKSLYYLSEEDLFRRKPQYAIRPDDPAVLQFDYDVDWGKPVSEARVRVVAGRWKAPPGEPIIVEGYGPPDGRWLVIGWRRDYFNPIVEITLKQPSREKMESAPQATTGTDSSGDEGLGLSEGSDAGKRVVRAYNRANAIDAKGQSYKWGGGHGSFNDPGGYDCSGFVSSCLHAGGMLSGAPQSTTGLQNWGEAGEGKYMTVWVKETGVATQSHTFLTFRLKGKTRYAEAGGSQSGSTGWHSPRSHAGFKPRHYAGT